MKRWLPTAAYLLVVAMGAFGLWRVESTANQVAEEARRREAQSCISGFEVREQIRDAIETATLAGSEALIAVAGADADPRDVELFRQTILEQVAAARGEVGDPACDLAAARRVTER